MVGFGGSANPGVRLVRYLGQHQQIVPAKSIGRLPLILVFINPGEGDVVSNDVTDAVLPNGRFDVAQAHVLNGSFSW